MFRFSFLCMFVLAILALPLAMRPRQVVCPILMYHHLVDATTDAEMRTWSVNSRDFDQQMAWLQSQHYRCVTPAQIAESLAGECDLPARPICITFDDGWAEQYAQAWPILRLHALTATFFVYTAGIDAGGWMTWAQLREMAAAGCDVECHTIDHPALPGLSASALRRELAEPKATIESHLGRPVSVIAYPFGKYNDDVLAASASAGYRCGVSIDPGIIQSEAEEFRLRRIMVSNGEPLATFIQRVRGLGR